MSTNIATTSLSTTPPHPNPLATTNDSDSPIPDIQIEDTSIAGKPVSEDLSPTLDAVSPDTTTTNFQVDENEILQDIDDAKVIMNKNIEALQQRGENVDDLSQTSKKLSNKTSEFKQASAHVHRNLWKRSVRSKIICGIIVLIILGFVALLVYIQAAASN